MNEERKVTIMEAARILAITQDEVRCLMSSGDLKYVYDEGICDNVIFLSEVEAYKAKFRREPAPTDQLRVAIIDDEINYANILKLELSRDKRIIAKFATWGLDGINLCRQFKPHLLLLDYNLPDMKGEQFLEQLKKVIPQSGMKVIVFTAHLPSVAHPEKLTTELGVKEIFDKTRSMRDLVARVYQELGIERRKSNFQA